MTQRQYERQLKGIAGHIDRLIRATGADYAEFPSLVKLLRAYAKALGPWAIRTGIRMIAEVDREERTSWRSLGNAISESMQQQIQSTPMGERFKGLLAEQVGLITSLPEEASQRVHDLTVEGLQGSVRASEIAEKIYEGGRVTKSRALMIARTEVGRTQTSLLQARCEHVGATHYIWRTAGDGDVRKGHKAMAGKTCAWAAPPAVEENGKTMHFHPGSIWNCRCYAEPVIATP